MEVLLGRSFRQISYHFSIPYWEEPKKGLPALLRKASSHARIPNEGKMATLLPKLMSGKLRVTE